MSESVIVEKHINASGMYADTETTVAYAPGSKVVAVSVEMLPFLSYWKQPSAALMRKWVDEILKGQGMKRDGARIAHTDGPLNKWRFTYYVKPID